MGVDLSVLVYGKTIEPERGIISQITFHLTILFRLDKDIMRIQILAEDTKGGDLFRKPQEDKQKIFVRI